MAINLFRHDPSKWISAVEETFKESTELKKAKQTKNLIEIVRNAQKQVPLLIDEVANEACRVNNKAVVEKAEKTPTLGGNIQVYRTKITGM